MLELHSDLHGSPSFAYHVSSTYVSENDIVRLKSFSIFLESKRQVSWQHRDVRRWGTSKKEDVAITQSGMVVSEFSVKDT